MNLTPKYPNCQNCGANDYEMNSLNTVKCEYCGTKYEIELPERETIISHNFIPLSLTANVDNYVDRIDFNYRTDEVRCYNGAGELIKVI